MSKGRLSIFALAGFCGGMAEVVWVWSYSAATGSTGIDVARQITATMFPSMASLPVAAFLGIAIHFVLAVGLGIAFGLLIWRPFASRLSRTASALVGITFLCLLWAINFFIVLPALNPVFVALLPYPVTLLSKALFGVAMVWMLQAARALQERSSKSAEICARSQGSAASAARSARSLNRSASADLPSSASM